MKKVWSWIGGLFKKVTKTVGGYYKSVKEKVAGYYKTVKERVAGYYKTVKERVAGYYKSVKERVPGYYKTVKERVAGYYKTVKKVVAGGYKMVKKTIAGHYKTVKKVVKGGYKMVKKTVAAGYKWVTKTLPGHYEAAKRWVEDKVEAVNKAINSSVANTVNKIGIVLLDKEFSFTNPFTATTYKLNVSEVVNPGAIVVGPNGITAEENGVLGKYDYKAEAGIELSPFEGKFGTYVLEGGIGNYSQLYITPEIGNDYFGMKAGLGSECRGLFDQTQVQKYVFATKPTSINNSGTEIAFTVTQKPVKKLRNQAIVVGGVLIVVYGLPAVAAGVGTGTVGAGTAGAGALVTKVLEWLSGGGTPAIP